MNHLLGQNTILWSGFEFKDINPRKNRVECTMLLQDCKTNVERPILINTIVL